MKVVDTHAHFWDVGTLTYPWIEKGSSFDRSFLPDDYRRASAGRPIDRMIFVECDAAARCSIAEAEWVAGLALIDPRIQGIVARVALLEDGAMATLDAMAAMPLVRGIRDNIQGHAPGWGAGIWNSFIRPCSMNSKAATMRSTLRIRGVQTVISSLPDWRSDIDDRPRPAGRVISRGAGLFQSNS